MHIFGGLLIEVKQSVIKSVSSYLYSMNKNIHEEEIYQKVKVQFHRIIIS